jgi:HK97 family phage prohead protease
MVGYALRWQQPAFIGRGSTRFEERFARGAFARSIAAGRITLCSNHDRGSIIAGQSDGSLSLVEDVVGLRVDAWANHTDAGDQAIHDARCRARAGLSVGFERPRSQWRDTEAGRLRLITECDLVEISVVRDPAYRSSELFAGKMRIEAFEARIAAAA